MLGWDTVSYILTFASGVLLPGTRRCSCTCAGTLDDKLLNILNNQLQRCTYGGYSLLTVLSVAVLCTVAGIAIGITLTFSVTSYRWAAPQQVDRSSAADNQLVGGSLTGTVPSETATDADTYAKQEAPAQFDIPHLTDTGVLRETEVLEPTGEPAKPLASIVTPSSKKGTVSKPAA